MKPNPAPSDEPASHNPRVRTPSRGLLRFGAGLSTRGLEAAGKFGLYALGVAWLGESPAGLFFLALTVVHLAATAARLGSERILAGNTAAYLAGGQKAEAGATIRRGLLLNLATSGAGALIFALGAPWLAALLGTPAMTPLLLILAIGLPGQTLSYAAGYILIGLGRPILAQLLMNAAPPVATLAALALGARSAESALLAFSLAYVASFAISLVVIGIHWLRLQPAPAVRHDRLPGLRAGLRDFYLVELIQAGIIGAPMFWLAHAATTAEVGAFSLANRLSMLVVTVVVSLGAMSSASLAGHLRLGDNEAVRRDLRRLGLAAAIVGLPAIAGLTILGPWLLQALGVTAPAAAPVLAVLALSQLPLTLLPGRDLLLSFAGESRALRRINFAQAAVMLVSCAALIAPFGLMGAGVAAALAWAFGPAACHLTARRRLPEAFGSR